MNYVKTVCLCENILRHFNIKKYNFFFILICHIYEYTVIFMNIWYYVIFQTFVRFNIFKVN